MTTRGRHRRGWRCRHPAAGARSSTVMVDTHPKIARCGMPQVRIPRQQRTAGAGGASRCLPWTLAAVTSSAPSNAAPAGGIGGGREGRGEPLLGHHVPGHLGAAADTEPANRLRKPGTIDPARASSRYRPGGPARGPGWRYRRGGSQRVGASGTQMRALARRKASRGRSLPRRRCRPDRPARTGCRSSR